MLSRRETRRIRRNESGSDGGRVTSVVMRATRTSCRINYRKLLGNLSTRESNNTIIPVPFPEWLRERLFSPVVQNAYNAASLEGLLKIRACLCASLLSPSVRYAIHTRTRASYERTVHEHLCFCRRFAVYKRK